MAYARHKQAHVQRNSTAFEYSCHIVKRVYHSPLWFTISVLPHLVVQWKRCYPLKWTRQPPKHLCSIASWSSFTTVQSKTSTSYQLHEAFRNHVVTMTTRATKPHLNSVSCVAHIQASCHQGMTSSSKHRRTIPQAYTIHASNTWLCYARP